MENLETSQSENLDLNNKVNTTFPSTMELIKWQWTNSTTSIVEKQESTNEPQNLEDNHTTAETPIMNPEDVSDGYIDDVQQGEANDCWLISELEALSQSQWGRAAIKNAIKKDNNWNYNVTLLWNSGTFVHKITKEDIELARQESWFSRWDLDVLLIELATEEYRKKRLWRKELDVMFSQDEDIFELLTWKEPKTIYGGFMGNTKEEWRNTLNKFKQNPDKYAICCGIPIGGAGNIGHQCTISRFETDEKWDSYVIIKNPYNTSVEIRMTEEKFIKIAERMDYIENVDYINDNPKINSDGQIWELSFSKKGTDKWALPTIKAISNENPDIISNSIHNINSNLEITLKWVNKKYTITPADIQRAKESGKYSWGDDDAIALEIAIERFCQREYGPADTSNENLKSNNFKGISLATIPDSTIIRILTGETNMHAGIDENGNYITTNTTFFKWMPREPIKTIRPIENKENNNVIPILKKLSRE